MPIFRKFNVAVQKNPLVLDLSWQNVGKTADKVVHKKFLQAITNTSAKIQKLNLSFNNLANLLTDSDHAFKHALLEAIKHKTPAYLDLSGNQLARVPLKTLGNIFSLLPNSLEQLDISGNRLFDNSVASLVQLLSPLSSVTIVFDTHTSSEKINSLQSELQSLGYNLQFVSKASLLEAESLIKPEIQNSEADHDQSRSPGISL